MAQKGRCRQRHRRKKVEGVVQGKGNGATEVWVAEKTAAVVPVAVESAVVVSEAVASAGVAPEAVATEEETRAVEVMVGVVQVVAAMVRAPTVEVAKAVEPMAVITAAVVVVTDTEMSHRQTAGCGQYRWLCPSR
jgi:hypothetical protein